MENKFNQRLFFNNIYFLVKERSKKIGELESESGVSPGYIARTSKESNTKPSIDFVMNVAKILNVSLDALLKINFTELNSTETYLFSFFQKLSTDTISSKLEWKRETIKYLNNIGCNQYGMPEHPLFQMVEPGDEDNFGKTLDSPQIIFVSKSFGFDTIINGDCFNLELKNQTTLYIFNIKRHTETSTTNAFTKEVWIYHPTGVPEFLYSSFGEQKLSNLLETLYSNIVEDLKHPKIHKSVRNVIDAFMDNDIGDDDIVF